MKPIIDSHVHVLPDRISSLVPESQRERLQSLRRNARSWLKPITGSMHRAQTMLRHLPDAARKPVDQLSGFAPLPGLLVESTPTDLKELMSEAGVHYSVVIAHPPLIENEFVLDLAAADPSIIPVVNIAAGTSRPGQLLKKYAERGAKMLKIHPASDGEGVDSPRYKTLVRTADELGLPVIIHTGCIHTHLLYKDPHQGHAERFAPWFSAFPKTKFILAHMNFHQPHIALDLAEEYENVIVETSWQPAEAIGEAARRIGAERVLFGTDWPFVGSNFEVGISRVRDCVESGVLSSDDADLILGLNAAKLLGLPEVAPDHAASV